MKKRTKVYQVICCQGGDDAGNDSGQLCVFGTRKQAERYMEYLRVDIGLDDKMKIIVHEVPLFFFRTL